MGIYKLKDPKDIYEAGASSGSKRARACILAIIPPDVTEAAMEQCDKTLAMPSNESIEDRVRKLVGAFQTNHQIPQSAIEKRLRHGIDSTNEQELIQLFKIFTSIKDGVANRDRFFELESSIQGDAAELNEKFSSKDPEKKEK